MKWGICAHDLPRSLYPSRTLANVGGRDLDARKYFGYSVSALEAHAMRNWLRRIYGQYKLNKVSFYLERRIREALNHDEWEQMRDLLDAGEIVLDARDSF